MSCGVRCRIRAAADCHGDINVQHLHRTAGIDSAMATSPCGYCPVRSPPNAGAPSAGVVGSRLNDPGRLADPLHWAHSALLHWRPHPLKPDPQEPFIAVAEHPTSPLWDAWCRERPWRLVRAAPIHLCAAAVGRPPLRSLHHQVIACVCKTFSD